MYKEARGNLELRNEILAEVKGKILQHEQLHSVELPHNLRVVRSLFIMLDRSEIAIIQQILALAFTGKNKEDTGEGKNAGEEKARPIKAGYYKKIFTAFTAAKQVFKEEMDAYDRERRHTKDPKTIGQRTRIVQHWWESLSNNQKLEAGRAAENHWQTNLLTMAKDFLIETVQRTMGSHVVMIVGHESGEGQIKLAVVEEDSAEKQEVERSLDEDGNPEVPTWGGQKLKVKQNLARAVFQAAYAKFTKKPKAKVPWGLLIKSPMEYLDSESILEGFTIKDPSKWTKAELGLLWDHWQSLEGEVKVIVSFIDCKKEDAPLSRQFDRKVVGSSKKRVWVTVDDDSEAEVGGAGILGPSVTQHSVGGPSEQTVDGGEVLGEPTTDAGQSNPEESSPAWHASKDHICYLKSLSIMPRYQVPVDLVDALPEQIRAWKGDRGRLPPLGNLDLECQVLARGNSLGFGHFLKGNWRVAKCRFSSCSRGLEVVLGLGLLLRECSSAQVVEEDDPVEKGCSYRLSAPRNPKGEMGVLGWKEKEEEEAPPWKRKRVGSGIVTRGQKMAKKDEGKGKKVEENERRE
ncbi:hypothetical protein EDD16DRAFT_1522714 [Pisolithus croceorrhizus]|nr:hypothetical protein EV401DRAFT_1895756 [Pisolithus croceorrhizus]KAI6109066.1 hypothetical protein EDD16DRAFT_1522714 [Pisolithus croceorrhizus]KAI6147564.1 hypothetical protein EDD17DRAFT_1514545 [Pisolithus thermaeus]